MIRSVQKCIGALAALAVATTVQGATVLTAPQGQSSGLTLKLSYEALGARGNLSRRGALFVLPQPSTDAEKAALEFLSEASLGPSVPLRVHGRMRWGRYDVLVLMVRNAAGSDIPTPLFVDCTNACRVDRAVLGSLVSEDQTLLSSTVAYLASAPAAAFVPDSRTTNSALATFDFLPSALGPGAGIRYEVALRSYAAGSSGQVRSLDLDANAWSGGEPAEPELRAVGKFLVELRKRAAGPVNTAGELVNTLFGIPHAERYAYTINTFDSLGGRVSVRSDLLPVDRYAQATGRWKAFAPLGYIEHNGGRYVVFASSMDRKDIQIVATKCQAGSCMLSADLSFQFPADALQNPHLLRVFYERLTKR